MRKCSLHRRQFLTAVSGLGSAAFLGLRIESAQAEEEPKLRFFNWDTYIGETTLMDFYDTSGIRVHMSLFGDNSEMFAKFREGNPGFDLVVPSDSWVPRMIKADMLQPLNHRQIPNFRRNVSPRFQHASFDPGRTYSMPYMWGTVGLGYRKSTFGSPPDSWGYLFNPTNKSLRIAWIGDIDLLFGAAGQYLGIGVNPKTESEINECEKLLTQAKQHVLTISPDGGQDLLLSGEVDLVIEWSGDISQVIKEDPGLAYVIPKEGSIIWQDTLVVPKGAPHPHNAHSFINFLLDGEVGWKLANLIQYGTPNEASLKLASPEYINNKSIFPSEGVLDRCEPITYQGESVLERRELAFSRVRAA